MEGEEREREEDKHRQTETQRDAKRHRDQGLGGWTALEVRDTRALWKRDMQKQAKQGKKVAEKET